MACDGEQILGAVLDAFLHLGLLDNPAQSVAAISW
jgi:hypothetical protein